MVLYIRWYWRHLLDHSGLMSSTPGQLTAMMTSVNSLGYFAPNYALQLDVYLLEGLNRAGYLAITHA